MRMGRARSSLASFLLSGLGIAVLIFLVMPIFIVVPMSFSASRFLSFPPTALSPRWYLEFFGSPDPYYDYEIIAMMHAISRRVGIEDFALLLNSIGCGSPDCRGGYVVRINSYFEDRRGELCEDCRRRPEKNPLRIPDCKPDACDH